MTQNDRKNLAARLTDLAKRLPTLDPPNTSDHNFHRTGLLLIRAGLAYINEGDRARALASDWSARGYPAGGSDGTRSSTNDSSTERAALNGTDQWETTVAMLDLERRLLEDNAFSAEHRVANIVKLAPTEQIHTAVGAGNCEACNVYCSGAVDDRLRSGYCNACRMAWDRDGRPDRAGFNRRRKVGTNR